jgi:8-oxo-dGTP diphosphatase
MHAPVFIIVLYGRGKENPSGRNSTYNQYTVNNLYLNVHVVIFSLCDNAVQVLLAPGEIDSWQLPGQEVGTAESLESAAVRAFASQLGHGEAYLEQLYTYGEPGRIPGQRTVSVVYFALIPSDTQRTTSTGKMRWFRLNELPALAYDHEEIIRYALRRLHYKIEYSAAGFELLPDEFTLSELQQTYEIILGEKLDKRNFRRRILEAGIIEGTPRRRSGEGRPARLYRYRADAVAEVKARRLFP